MILTLGIGIFRVGDKVYARNYSGIPTWIAGTVTGLEGVVNCRVQLADGRHADQLRSRLLEQKLQDFEEEEPDFVGTGSSNPLSGDFTSGNTGEAASTEPTRDIPDSTESTVEP